MYRPTCKKKFQKNKLNLNISVIIIIIIIIIRSRRRRVFILCDNYNLTLPNVIPRVCSPLSRYVLTISEPTGSYKRYLSDKIMLYTDRYIELCIHTI